MPLIHFFVFILVSLIVFVAILRWVVRARPVTPSFAITGGIAFIVVVVGMCFAKFGANAGLTWHVYYGVPAVTTLVLPPLAFRMQRGELVWYLVLSFASSPVIHVFFSLFIGWPEYMPFWRIPSLWGTPSAGA